MRITNKIMQKNSLSNINTNKILQDKLNTQMVTEKKITRPSDDPVIAIRALRLRGTLSELDQYYSKNAEDANSWLEITQSALKTAQDVLDDMHQLCNDGASDTLQPEDRQSLLTSLKNLRDSIYSAGDSDYAGRNVFTGYRTGTKLTFQADASQTYRITEELNGGDVEKIKYIKTNSLGSVDEHNYKNPPYSGVTEYDVTDKEIDRIRLAYDNLDKGCVPQITDEDGQPIQFTPPGGTAQNIVVTEASLYDTPDPYDSLGDNDAVYVPETGELLLGKNVSDKIASMKDDPRTQNADEGAVRITYDKTEWKKGDLNPVNYYACSAVTRTTTPPAPPATQPAVSWNETMKYNGGWQTGRYEAQVIEYDVGFNQKIRINTTADECFNHDIGRDVDELMIITEQVIEMQAAYDQMKKLAEEDPDDADAQERMLATGKALDGLKDKMQKMFSAGQTSFKEYKDNMSKAETNSGTRSARLDLIKDRLSSQLTTFDELASNNENADTTQLAIELSSAELSYEAALLATGKIVQTTLLNFL